MASEVRSEERMQPQADVAGETLIRVEGTLDGLAARRVEVALTRANAGARFRIDLTQVREFHDFGVALLAKTISARRAPTAVLGLHEHHLRLLRYLGIECGGANLAAGVELN